MKSLTIATLIGITALSYGLAYGFALGTLSNKGPQEKKYQIFIVAQPMPDNRPGTDTTVSIYEDNKLLVSRYKLRDQKLRALEAGMALEGRAEIFYSEYRGKSGSLGLSGVIRGEEFR